MSYYDASGREVDGALAQAANAWNASGARVHIHPVPDARKADVIVRIDDRTLLRHCGRDCLGYSTSIGRPRGGHVEILLNGASSGDTRPLSVWVAAREFGARPRPAPSRRPDLLDHEPDRVRQPLRAAGRRARRDARDLALHAGAGRRGGRGPPVRRTSGARRAKLPLKYRPRPCPGPACSRSCASGAGSAASGSAGRRRTSRCCATCASSGAAGWTRREFEDAIAACNLLPGPASTQLAIFCAWRLRGPARRAGRRARRSSCPAWSRSWRWSALFLAGSPPRWVRGAGRRRGRGGRRGGGARRAAASLPAELGARARAPGARAGSPTCARRRRRGRDGRAVARARAARLRRARARAGGARRPRRRRRAWLRAAARRGGRGAAGCGALAWVAFKVGALSYGGGFVIVPLMQADAVDHYHWMTERPVPQRGRARPDHAGAGRRTPSPRSATPRPGSAAALLAAVVAFAPSFAFVLLGAPRASTGSAATDARARVPRRRRPRGDRRDPRLGDPLARALTEAWQYVRCSRPPRCCCWWRAAASSTDAAVRGGRRRGQSARLECPDSEVRSQAARCMVVSGARRPPSKLRIGH